MYQLRISRYLSSVASFFMTLSCLLELLMQAYLGVHENGAKVQKEQELASWVGSAGIQRTINGSGGFPVLKSARREPGLDPIKGGLFALPLHLHCGSVDHCCQLPLSTSLQLLQRELKLFLTLVPHCSHV